MSGCDACVAATQWQGGDKPKDKRGAVSMAELKAGQHLHSDDDGSHGTDWSLENYPGYCVAQENKFSYCLSYLTNKRSKILRHIICNTPNPRNEHPEEKKKSVRERARALIN